MNISPRNKIPWALNKTVICLRGNMDYFEGIIKTLLEYDGYWVRQSFKVNLTKEEKRAVGKPSIPRPEIDLIAYKPGLDTVIALEAKSFLDSPGVKLEDLDQQFEVPEGRYKLFTCQTYREIVLSRLRSDLEDAGMLGSKTKIKLGMAAGNVYRSKSSEIRRMFSDYGWLFISPEDIKEKVSNLAKTGYENEPAIITAKILMRDAK